MHRFLATSLVLLTMPLYGVIDVNWFTSGNVLAEGSLAGAPAPAPPGSLWQLIWSPDDTISTLDANNPLVPTGGEVVLDMYTSGASDFGQIDTDPGAPGAQGVSETYGTGPDFVGGFVYTRIFSSSTPGAGDFFTESAIVGPSPNFGVLIPRPPPVAMDVLNVSGPNIVDFNGTAVLEIDMPLPTGVCIALSLSSQPDCGGSSGSANAIPVGGVGPFQFQWDAAAGNQQGNTATGLAAGTYRVSVTDVGLDCTVEDTVTVTSDCVAFDVEVTDNPCPSVEEGAAEVVNLSFPGSSSTTTWNVPASATIAGDRVTGLAAGSYSVTVRDDLGNEETLPFTVVSPFADIDYQIEKVDPLCGVVGGGSASVVGLSGGSGNYTFQWSANAGNSTASTVTGLGAGNYTVTVSDASAASCTKTMMVTLITDGSPPVLNCTANLTVDDNCAATWTGFDPEAAALATDESGTPVPAGLVTVLNDNLPCSIEVEYQFSLTNDCTSTTCTSRVTFNGPAATLASPIPAALQDMSRDCTEGVPVPDPDLFAGAVNACGDVSVTFSVDSPSSCISSRPTTIRYVGTDACTGTEVVHVQTITFAPDTTAPVVQPIAPLDLDGCNPDIPDPNITLVQATDECNGITREFVSESTEPGTGGRSTLVRIYRATDGCGNATEVEHRISFLSDPNAPTFGNLPASLSRSSETCSVTVPDFVNAPPAEIGSLSVVDEDPTSVVLTQSPSAGTVLSSPGLHRVFIMATDLCGNMGVSFVDILVTCPGLEAGSISGTKYHDRNGNGVFDQDRPDEFRVPGATIYLDLNRNGQLDPNDISTVTDGGGGYEFSFLGAADYSVREDVAPGEFIQTAPEGAHEVSLALGESRTGLDFGNQGQLKICGTVWEDLDTDGDPGMENLDQTGVGGATVSLFIVTPAARPARGTAAAVFVESQVSAVDGRYCFDHIPPGSTFEIRFDSDSLPAELTGRSFTTPQAGSVVIPATIDGEPAFGLNFSLAPDATAVELVYFRAEGNRVSWLTGWEKGSLGFLVMRQVGAEGEPEQVTDRLVLATGGGGGMAYEIIDPEPPASGQQVFYFLREIEEDLDVIDYESTRLVHAAAPVEGETGVYDAAGGALEVDTVESFDNYLIMDITPDGSLNDVSDPADPIPLLGERLETDGGTGVYFSWPAGRTLQVK